MPLSNRAYLLQVLTVATALTVDYDLLDRTVIEALLSKLHAAKQKRFLALLLDFCRFVLVIEAICYTTSPLCLMH